MLASRLLSILLRLQACGRMSASQLAQALEVTVRTIHRDIDQLSAAGIPVYVDRSRNGGFQLRDYIESLDFGVRELLRLGNEVMVLGPPTLRAELAQAAGRIAKLHRLPISRRTS
ncbi:helix-turn-helix transcriptional regulator [Dyella nitratireducens]|uniref:HTH deoR-type domain-containing protein n=1 Tax=Dyella nitratireducens TaxID=1849580 RepID=A0ABQ1FLC6_9GAMM|nr:HTH domain-containing protein [Dyella nitratireducens]GGA19669.1 hypothetical protein GCM10010981_04590 [Dyella nitratireducens]GLQ44479.1 hypothetical protein GCM10007902_43290 [Dyella nitratireducens]